MANKHLRHLEETIFTDGVAGAKESIKALREIGKFLSSGGSSAMVTEKFDGAPAVICGIDPVDGQFFVGTKSVFNAKEPKVAKSVKDIKEMYSGGVVPKLIDSYEYLKDAKIQGVLQGDLMFTNDKNTQTINGKNYVTFKPNTITYAVDPNSQVGKKITTAKLGIVFHTSYSGGKTIQEMKASFSVKQGAYTPTNNTWIQKAEFTNITKAIQFSTKEKQEYEACIRMAEGSMKQAGDFLNKLQSGKKALAFDTEFLKFFNGYVKQGKAVPSVKGAYNDFFKHLGQEYNKIIKKYKKLDSQANKASDFIDKLDFIEKNQRQMMMVIATYMNLAKAKMIAFNRMKQVSALNTFVQEGNGDFRATTPEGYVATVDGKATKLIDRLEFSKLNFTIPKNWN